MQIAQPPHILDLSALSQNPVVVTDDIKTDSIRKLYYREGVVETYVYTLRRCSTCPPGKPLQIKPLQLK